MKQMKLILASALLLLSLVALVSCTAPSEVPDGMREATAAGDPFHLYVPTTWHENTGTGVSGAYYITYATSSLTVTGQESGTTTAEQFLEECLAEYDTRFGDHLKDRQTEPSVLGGEDAVTATFSAWDDAGEYRILLVATIHEGKHYLLTFVATGAVYEACLNDVAHIVREFRFSETPFVPEKTKKLSEAPAPAGMKTASTDQVPFRFYVPENWQIDLYNANTVAYYSDSDRSNVQVTAYVPAGQFQNFDAYHEWVVKTYRTVLSDFTEISRETDLTVSGRKAEVWEFSGKIGGETYHYRQIVTVYNSVFNSCFYTVTYTALEENYAAHLEDVLRMQKEMEFR